MSPINIGRDYWKVITNQPHKIEERTPMDNALDRLMFFYRDWHDRLGEFHVFGKEDPIMTVGLHANEYLARRRYDIPTLTETPVDRWMERLRGRPAATP